MTLADAREVAVSAPGGAGGEMEAGLMQGEAACEPPPDAGADLTEIPWADSRTFIVDLFVCSALGCALGAFSYPYGILTDKVHEHWLEKTGPANLWEDAANMAFRGGSTTWILIAWLCCTAVGVLKVIIRLDKYPSFITELKTQHVEPTVSFKVLIGCVASLCAGGTLGLEAGLGATGAAVGLLTCQLVHHMRPDLRDDAEKAELRRRTYILCGIAAGFGAILPTPAVSVMLCGEVASAGTERRPEAGEFMVGRRLPKRVAVFLVPAASFAFMTRYAISPSPLTSKLGVMVEYDNLWPLYAIPLGAIAALVGLVFLLIQAFTKKLIDRLSEPIERVAGTCTRQILLASLAGVVTGLGIYCFPLAYSSGRSAMILSIKHREALSSATLFGTALTKCLTFWIGIHCGLVGGLFFPLMYVGLVAGELCARAFGLHFGVCIPLMVGAVPASFVTAPLTLMMLPIGLFVMGPLNAIPIFIAVVTSNTLLVGTGLLNKLMAKGRS